MKKGTIIVLIAGLISGCLILSLFLVFIDHLPGAATDDYSYSLSSVWTEKYSNPSDAQFPFGYALPKVKDDVYNLVVSNDHNVSILDLNGNFRETWEYAAPAFFARASSADSDYQLYVYYMGNGASVDVEKDGITSNLAQMLPIGEPSRIIVDKLSDGDRLILGDTTGNILVLTTGGQPLWNTSIGPGRVIALATDYFAGEGDFLVAASSDGVVRLMKETGETVWEKHLEEICCPRIAEGKDGDEIVIGGKSGSLGAYNLLDGAPVFSKDLGESISSLEQAGGGSDPGTGANIPEYLYVGGANGAVFKFDAVGNQYWSNSMRGSVTSLYAFGDPSSGNSFWIYSLLAGNDKGDLAVFSADGILVSMLPSRGAAIRLIQASGTDHIIIGDEAGISSENLLSDTNAFDRKQNIMAVIAFLAGCGIEIAVVWLVRRWVRPRR